MRLESPNRSDAAGRLDGLLPLRQRLVSTVRARLITATGAPVSDPARSKVPRQHAGVETGAPVVVSRWPHAPHAPDP